jgi:hypothetical protein
MVSCCCCYRHVFLLRLLLLLLLLLLPLPLAAVLKLDTTTIEDKLNRLAAGMGAVEYFESEEKEDKREPFALPLTEADEDQIVEEYKKIDSNFPVVCILIFFLFCAMMGASNVFKYRHPS